MTTITALELRNNMEAIIKRVMAGEEIAVTYRHQPAVRLSADVAKPKSGKKMSGLDAMLAAPRKKHTFDPNKSMKELYHEMLDKKYGIK